MTDITYVDFRTKRVLERVVVKEGYDSVESVLGHDSPEALRLREESLIEAHTLMHEALEQGFDVSKAVLMIPHPDPSFGIAVLSMGGFESDAEAVDLMKSAIEKMSALIGG